MEDRRAMSFTPEVNHKSGSPRSESIALAEHIERRVAPRHPYDALIGLVLLDGRDRATEPIILRARDLSDGGVRIASRHPLKIHRRGVVQIVRTDGRRALAGVEVRHCRYAGDETHEVGLKFTAIPDSPDSKRWLDDCGTPILFDALLSEIAGQ